MNKYIIIRTRGDISKTKEIIDICNNSGANTIVYDQTFNERNNINEDIVNDIAYDIENELNLIYSKETMSFRIYSN